MMTGITRSAFRVRRAAWPAITAIALAAPGLVTAQELRRDAVREDGVTIAGRRIGYRVEADETPVIGRDGKAGATIFAVSYVRDAREAALRPVMFFFNGGPGSPTFSLHRALGPRRFVSSPPDAQGKVRGVPAENGRSLLDRADLVFIDPVGTGYSRVLPGGDPKNYWGVEPDAAATAQFITGWLAHHHRAASPVVIAGESYGGLRAVVVADRLSATPAPPHLAGLLLISPATDASWNEEAIDPVDIFPTYAATAWFHRKGSLASVSGQAAYRDANRFAGHDLASAIAATEAGAPPSSPIAKAAARHIGLPAATLVTDRLAVPRADFLTGLLKDQGERVGLLDGRTHQPLRETAKFTPPYDDPSTTHWQVPYDSREAIDRYYRDVVGYRPVAPYVWLALDASRTWDWTVPERYRHGTGAVLREIMDRCPGLKVMVSLGIYDLTIPASIPARAFRAAALPPDRTRIELFETGHAVFNDDGRAGADAIAAVRSFLLAAPTPRRSAPSR